MNSDMPTDRATPLKDASDLITSMTISGVLYAYSFLFYCLSTRLFYFQCRDIDGKLNRHTVLTVAVCSTAMLCATINIITFNQHVRMVYSDTNIPPGGSDGALVAVPGFTIVKVNIIVTFVQTMVSLATKVSLHLLWLSSSHVALVMARSDCLV
jgi:hypothetical protein